MRRVLSGIASFTAIAGLTVSFAGAAPLLSIGGLGLGDNGGTQAPVDASVPDVVDASSGGGSTDISLFGGGRSALNVDGSALGDQPGEIGLYLPGLGGLGGVGGSGGDGGNGSDGSNVAAGGSGATGGSGGSSGAAGAGPSRVDRLRTVLEDRDWLRLAANNGVCVSSVEIADLKTWLPQAEWGRAQRVINDYSRDISTLQKMLANCGPNAGTLGMGNIARVVGVDVQGNRTILYVL